MAWPAVKLGCTQDQFPEYLKRIDWAHTPWRPRKIMIHNTAAPSLFDWHKTAADDIRRGVKPGTTRINNLEHYFWKEKRWSGCPHLFITDDLIWIMNPLTAPGVGSPSYNTTAIHIEMVADFSREDDDSGAGLKVKNNTAFATALLCETFGLDPYTDILLHKDDKATTHDCPGKDFADDRKAFVASVAALLRGGEHSTDDIAIAIGEKTAPPVIVKPGTVNTHGAKDLSLRAGPGVSNRKVGALANGAPLGVLDKATNETTGWLLVETTLGKGWVSAKYVDLK